MHRDSMKKDENLLESPNLYRASSSWLYLRETPNSLTTGDTLVRVVSVSVMP